MSDATPPRRRATLRDVAREAGVSHMTVSRVIRGHATVTADTESRVRAAVEKLHYTADPALSALAAYRTRGGGLGKGSVLAYLDVDNNPYSHAVLAGVREEAERLGYGVDVHPVLPSPAQQKRLERMLYHRGNRGLLFGPSEIPWHFEGWNWDNFAMVSLGALTHQPAMNAVAVDYFDGATRALRHLENLGARRIGWVVSRRLESRTAHRWLGAYASGLGERKPILYLHETWSPREMQAWVRKTGVDGILTIHQPAWEALHPLGIPLVFLNDFDCPPGVPHIAHNAGRIGLEGVRLIHHQLLNQEYGLPEEVKILTLQASLVGTVISQP